MVVVLQINIIVHSYIIVGQSCVLSGVGVKILIGSRACNCIFFTDCSMALRYCGLGTAAESCKLFTTEIPPDLGD